MCVIIWIAWRFLGSTPEEIQQVWESAFSQKPGVWGSGNPWTSLGSESLCDLSLLPETSPNKASLWPPHLSICLCQCHALKTASLDLSGPCSSPWLGITLCIEFLTLLESVVPSFLRTTPLFPHPETDLNDKEYQGEDDEGMPLSRYNKGMLFKQGVKSYQQRTAYL